MGSAVRQDRDWEYLYDGLDRLARADRGREEGGFTPSANSLKWNLDILGNWDALWTDANGDGVFADTLAERENRTHNLANEVTLQSRPDGVSAQIAGRGRGVDA